jgi:2-methylcitrate dehydratase PrpD
MVTPDCPSATAISATLATFIAASKWADMPDSVRRAARQATLNWLGCALGGSHDETVERLWAGLQDFAGPPHATLLGRAEKTDALTAALVNAVSSNVLDFDDTHLATVVHPTAVVAPALLALAEHRHSSGQDFLHALALGIECACRIGNAVGPAHYENGWHISGTCGVFGAAVAAGKLLGLDAQRMNRAIGIAATSASGLRLQLGSMTKCHNLGNAARSGLQAALLAAHGFTSSERALEAPRGFLSVLADAPDCEAVTCGLGEHWEILALAYKPYPCGVVIHPVIDACLDLPAQCAITAAAVARVDVFVNPLAIKLCGNPAPRNGLEAKLSIAHSVAVALIDGAAGVAQYLDARATDPAALALRTKVVLKPDAAIGKEQARVRITLADGGAHELFVEHARGSNGRPLSDAELETKFRGLANGVLSPPQIETTLGICRSLDTTSDACALARAAAG